MSNRNISPMEVRKIKIKLEDGSLIRGKINLHSEYKEGGVENFSQTYDGSSNLGVFHNRVSDLFSKGKNAFITLFDISGEGFDDGGTLIINKKRVVWVFPED